MMTRGSSTDKVVFDVKPSEIAHKFRLPFNPREDIVTSINGAKLVQSSDAPHRIYFSSTSLVSDVSATSGNHEMLDPLPRLLHVFLTGTGAPALERNICKDFLSTTSSNLAYRVPTIALSYEWMTLTDSERNSMIENDSSLDLPQKHQALKLCHKDICFGASTDSTSVTSRTHMYHQVNISECVSQRLVRLLAYLHFERPTEDWIQYLRVVSKEQALLNPSDSVILQRANNEEAIFTVDWSKIIISGHSQGSGHAAYIGMCRLVHRVVLFSGPQEGLTDDVHEAERYHWLSNTEDECKLSESNSMLALKHAYEEGTSELIRKNWRLMAAFKDIPEDNILVINTSSWKDHVKEILRLKAMGKKALLFETFVPYNGYKEGVPVAGRPFHGSTVIDGLTPESSQYEEGREPGEKRKAENSDKSAYKKIIWSFLILGERGINQFYESNY